MLKITQLVSRMRRKESKFSSSERSQGLLAVPRGETQDDRILRRVCQEWGQRGKLEARSEPEAGKRKPDP